MKTHLRILFVFTLAGIATQLFAQPFNPTTPALNFGVFTRLNVTAAGGIVEGPTAMGGDLQLNGSSVFASNSSGTYPTGTLNSSSNYGMVIGGKMTFTSGNASQLNQGLLRIGSTTGARVFYTDCNSAGTNLKLTPYNADCNTAFNSYPNLMLQRQQASGTATSAHGVDFSTAFTKFNQYAAALNDYTGTDNSQLNKITISNTSNPHITLQDNKINYINLTATQLNNLANLGSVIFDNRPTATAVLVFNIAASGTVDWNVANFGGLSGTDANYILFNFFGTTALTIQGSNPVYGTVFSPLADVTKSNSNLLHGQLIGTSLQLQAGQISYVPFKALLPNFSSSPLPVRLLSFGGQVANGQAELNWSISQTETGGSFELQKSSGDAQFVTVFTTAITSTSNYSYKENAYGTGLYRLKMMNNDGSFSYSNVININAGASGDDRIVLLQNPVVNTLKFQFTAVQKSNAIITLYSTSGLCALKTSIAVEKGVNSMAIDAATLSRGSYLLRVQTTDGASITKVVK